LRKALLEGEQGGAMLPAEQVFSEICPAVRKRIRRPDDFEAVPDPDDESFVRSDREE
jgi:hypothetical protein